MRKGPKCNNGACPYENKAEGDLDTPHKKSPHKDQHSDRLGDATLLALKIEDGAISQEPCSSGSWKGQGTSVPRASRGTWPC